MRDRVNARAATAIGVFLVGLTILLTYIEERSVANKPIQGKSPGVYVAIGVLLLSAGLFAWAREGFREIERRQNRIGQFIGEGNRILFDMLRSSKPEGLHQHSVDWANSVRDWFREKDNAHLAEQFDNPSAARTARELVTADQAAQESLWLAIEEGHRTRLANLGQTLLGML